MLKFLSARAWDELPARFFVIAILGVGGIEMISMQFFADRDPTLPLLALRSLEIIGLLLLIWRMDLSHAVGLFQPDRHSLRVFAITAVLSGLGFGLMLAAAYAFDLPLMRYLGAPGWIHGGLGVLLMLAFAPLAEELFFRGVVYRLFRQSFGMPLAILLSASCFAMMHGQWLSPQLVGGFIFAVTYEWSRNIWVPVALHAGANAAVLLINM